MFFNIYHILAVGFWVNFSSGNFPFYFRHLKSWREGYSSAEERGLMMKSPKCKVLTSFNILCAPTGLLRPRIFYWWCQTLMAGFSNFYRYKHPILHIKQDILQYFYFYKIKRVDLLLVKLLAIDNALPDEAKVGLVIGVVQQWSAWFVAVPNWRLHSATACLSPPKVPTTLLPPTPNCSFPLSVLGGSVTQLACCLFPKSCTRCPNPINVPHPLA